MALITSFCGKLDFWQVAGRGRRELGDKRLPALQLAAASHRPVSPACLCTIATGGHEPRAVTPDAFTAAACDWLPMTATLQARSNQLSEREQRGRVTTIELSAVMSPWCPSLQVDR